MPKYYTKKGDIIHNPSAYAKTGAPMYTTKHSESKDINEKTFIYKLNLQDNKKYIGKTVDVNRRMKQHFSGGGSKVTKKFKPLHGEIVDEVPGFLSDDAEQYHTETQINKHGYSNVRGGKYVNSKTLNKSNTQHKTKTHTNVTCFKCGKQGHYANQCYASNNEKGSKGFSSFDSEDDY